MKILFVFVFLISAINSYSQSASISGTVIDKFLQTKVSNAKVRLNLRVKEKPTDEYHNQNITIHSFKTDSSGQFNFTVKDTGLYLIEVIAPLIVQDFDTFRFEKDTFIIKDAYLSELVEMSMLKSVVLDTMYITTYCPYRVTKNMKVCPKCLKPDKICKIIYGLPDFPVDEKGNLIEPIPCKLGGCVIHPCSPENYCNRCNLEF